MARAATTPWRRAWGGRARRPALASGRRSLREAPSGWRGPRRTAPGVAGYEAWPARLARRALPGTVPLISRGEIMRVRRWIRRSAVNRGEDRIRPEPPAAGAPAPPRPPLARRPVSAVPGPGARAAAGPPAPGPAGAGG